MGVCSSSSVLDLSDPCVRGTWSALLPVLAVCAFCISSLPIPSLSALHQRFRPFLTLQEAEALDTVDVTEYVAESSPRPSPVFTFLGLVQSLAWVTGGVFSFVVSHDSDVWPLIQSLLVAFSWLYTTVRPIAIPFSTAPYDLFTVYLLHLLGSVLLLGGYLFEYAVGGEPLPSSIVLGALGVNLGLVLVLLYCTLRMPINLPSARVRKEDIGLTVSPEDYTPLWEWIAYTWIAPLIRRGRNTTLHEKDVFNLSPTMQSRPVFLKFQSTPATTLLRRIVSAVAFDMFFDFVGTLFVILFFYAVPFFMKHMLDLIDQPQMTPRDKGMAYVYAGLMFLCSVLKAVFDVQHLWFGRRASTQVRSLLMAAIFEKTLKRKDFSGVVTKDKEGKGSKGGAADIGKIQNLMARDAEVVSNLVASIYSFLSAPFELILASIFLYQLLGWSAFSGLIIFFGCWPLNKYITSLSSTISKEKAKATDRRMAVVDELISSIKFIKFFAWEDRWVEQVMKTRNEELRWQVKGNVNRLMLTAMWSIAPISLSLVSFFVYVWLGNQLTVGTAFAAIAVFAIVRAPLNTIPEYIVNLVNAQVSLQRIAAYLAEDEVTAQVSSLKVEEEGLAPMKEGLGMEKASFEWNSVTAAPMNESVSTFAEHRFELKDISVMFPEGRLTVVTGPTASGKTALLMALMGEMTLLPTGGRLVMTKDDSLDEHGNTRGIAYAAQTPWLRHQSIRDNILFGSPFDEARYRQVVECCALKPDFDMLEDGDETEIGVKGVSLSGGQKSRVALARAVYSRKKYVLLDDPLSAVDSHTSRLLFEKCLQGPLLANRTVILVTHHVELVLPGAYYVVRMLDGRIEAQGTVQELRAQGILDEIAHKAEVEAEKEELVVATETPSGPDKDKKPRKLVEDEKRETGAVKLSVYRQYFAASSYSLLAVALALIMAQQVRSVGEKFWIKIWSESYERSFSPDTTTTRLPSASQRPLFYVGVYAAIALSGILIQMVSFGFQFLGALRASRVLFNGLLLNMVRATFRFHDTTPQGRIINRFSADFFTIDFRIVFSLQGIQNHLGALIAAVITVIVVFPPFLLPAAIVGYMYWYLAVGFVNTCRDLRRMESVMRSPILTNFSEVLTGVATVRAFSAERRFVDAMHVRIDNATTMWYTTWMMVRWLMMNYQLLTSISVFITALFAISFLQNDAGLAGLAVTSALAFNDSVYWASRSFSTGELEFNSVERVVEYMNVPQEAPAIIESRRPPAYWPSSSGNSSLLVVDRLSIKYAPDLPSVLQDVSFELKPGERIGLVGRTGSGKSTLAMSLLRFVDPSSGRILIDGIDISEIGVHDLRSRVTFIPQDATLFSGSLRDNLDPFGDYEDSACLDVLLRVNLISQSEIEADDGSSDTALDNKTKLSLDTRVSAGGANFSQGQRQLVALARALLRRSSIVVMDEATSSVDFATDSMIQTAIRTEFTDSLLITVAHRLRTIIDYDRLLVLDKGKVVEFDTPLNLMRKEGGLFRNMCLKSGTFGELEAAANGH
ncbi:P-loop containing nucleoside triphosphate hydrolase protein [Roridomyces roridus]|uniref:P-loop containing nucleoside triphosphate hydrolase protein n=1 Tax=Roridomyces roridus TaxID=1738132 RepID=A0AAD7FH66_9AGAR|nr:P-loop containing nucleoside triphosphate hydrolase protein [Roridomyces roridus]